MTRPASSGPASSELNAAEPNTAGSRGTGPNFADRVQYQGDPWLRLDTLPRLLAEGWRRTLREGGVVSVLRTPFQWVMASPVIEIETGGYLGDVGLYVPEVQWQEALAIMDSEDE